MTSFPTPAPFHLAEMAPPKRRRWLLPVALAGVLLLAGVGFAAWRLTAEPGVDPKVAACRDVVTQNLKAPSTAKFSEEKVGSTEDANGASYPTVDGVVDAQNDFGGVPRSRFHCTFNSDGTVRNAGFSTWP